MFYFFVPEESNADILNASYKKIQAVNLRIMVIGKPLSESL